MAFCPRCGKEAVDTFCNACLKDMHPLIKEVKPISIVKCSTCDRVLNRGGWTETKVIPKIVHHNLVFDSRARIADVDMPIPVFEDKVKEFDMPVDVAGTVSKFIDPYVEEYSIPLKITYDQCDRCKLAKGSYFEGILQLRNPRDDVVAFIEKSVQEAEDVFITKVKDVKGGIDFEFTDQKWLIQFAQNLYKRFGGEFKTQSKLQTYDAQTSKKVYRLTCMLRLPDFWRGDIIETEKRLMRVKRMGKMVQGFDLRRRKPTMIPCPQPKDYEQHEPVSVVMSRVQPHLAFLDPDDYQEVRLAHVAPVEAGQEIEVIQDSRDKWFIADELPQEREERKKQ